MKLIAHRGNTNGRNKELENSPKYVEKAIKEGFDVEVDVWLMDGVYLGHDNPEYETDIDFLLRHHRKLWIHCKNVAALSSLSAIQNLNVFWHESDAYTLTSQGFIWTYPHQKICEKSVIVARDAKYLKFQQCYGVCSDRLL
jgi:hypothetical protein